MHEKCLKSKTTNNNQRTFVTENGETLLEPKGIVFSLSEDLVIKAEILQALHFASSNYSFISAQSDNKYFCAIFPDSITTVIWKPKYSIQYGIAPYVRKMLIYNVNKNPFTSQTKKQCDGYPQLCLKRHQ